MLSVIAHGQPAGKEKVNRTPAVAGSFYPSNPGELEKMLSVFFKAEATTAGEQPLALVVPHAGYVFSGEVAAAGFRLTDRDKGLQAYFHHRTCPQNVFQRCGHLYARGFCHPPGKCTHRHACQGTGSET